MQLPVPLQVPAFWKVAVLKKAQVVPKEADAVPTRTAEKAVERALIQVPASVTIPCLPMQTPAFRYKPLHSDTGPCLPMQVHAFRCKSLPYDTSPGISIQVPTVRYKFLHPGTSSCTPKCLYSPCFTIQARQFSTSPHSPLQVPASWYEFLHSHKSVF